MPSGNNGKGAAPHPHGSEDKGKAHRKDATGAQPGAALTTAVFPLVRELTAAPARREAALLDLSKRREDFPELSGVLWHSYGTIAALLQEITGIYPALSPPALTAHASNRVCNALALLQCVASHPETRSLFLSGASVPGRRPVSAPA